MPEVRQVPTGKAQAEFSKKEKNVIPKNRVTSIALGLALCITGLCSAENSMAQGLAKERSDGKKQAGAFSNLDPTPSIVIRLVGASSQKITLPPPCSVVAVNGTKVTLKDFLGKMETVEVEDGKNIKVGDAVVVKHGVMRIRISPM